MNSRLRNAYARITRTIEAGTASIVDVAWVTIRGKLNDRRNPSNAYSVADHDGGAYSQRAHDDDPNGEQVQQGRRRDLGKE